MIQVSKLNSFTDVLIQKHLAKVILIAGTWLLFTAAPEDSDFLIYSLPTFLVLWFVTSVKLDLFRHDIDEIRRQLQKSTDL